MPGPSVDLLALLRPAQVVVTVAGTAFSLEAPTASQWLGALAVDLENLRGVMPGLIAEDGVEAMWEASRLPDIGERWTHASRVALGRGAGRDWWWALNLSRKALQSWPYTNGILLRQNVDAKKMCFPDWLDACYTLYWQGGDDESRMKLDMELSLRPRGVVVRGSRAADRQMLEAFAAD